MQQITYVAILKSYDVTEISLTEPPIIVAFKNIKKHLVKLITFFKHK